MLDSTLLSAYVAVRRDRLSAAVPIQRPTVRRRNARDGSLRLSASPSRTIRPDPRTCTCQLMPADRTNRLASRFGQLRPSRSHDKASGMRQTMQPRHVLVTGSQPVTAFFRRSIRRQIIGVKMSCIARSILPPGHTMVFGRDMKELCNIESR